MPSCRCYYSMLVLTNSIVFTTSPIPSIFILILSTSISFAPCLAAGVATFTSNPIHIQIFFLLLMYWQAFRASGTTLVLNNITKTLVNCFVHVRSCSIMLAMKIFRLFKSVGCAKPYQVAFRSVIGNWPVQVTFRLAISNRPFQSSFKSAIDNRPVQAIFRVSVRRP